MSDQTLVVFFLLSNVLVLPSYFAMIFAPNARWTHRFMQSLWSVALPALLHLILGITLIATQPDVLGVYGQYAFNIAKIPDFLNQISTPLFMMVAWVHMMAADLVMARWVFLDSRKREINAWFVSPPIFLIWVTGPLGFVFYMAVRLVHSRTQRRS